MSSILKALRKIEEEKRVAQHAAPDLRHDQGFSSAKARPLLPLFAGIVLGALCVGAFFLWPARDTSDDLAQLQPTTPIVTAPASKPAVEPENAVAPQGQKTAPIPPVESPAPASFNEQTKIQEVVFPAGVVAAAGTVPSRDSVKPRIEVSVPGDQAPGDSLEKTESKPVTKALPQTEKALAKAPVLPDGLSLRVAEIFYQKESADSMAVVNDLPVMVGTVVESAVVHEIRPDAVFFEVDGDIYEVAVTRP